VKQQEAQQLFAEVHRLHKAGQNNSQIAEALQLRRATVIEWLVENPIKTTAGGSKAELESTLTPRWSNGSAGSSSDECMTTISSAASMCRWITARVTRAWKSHRSGSLIASSVKPAFRPGSRKRNDGGLGLFIVPRGFHAPPGLIQESADFIGKKYLDGSPRPVTIFSSCYYRPFKMYQIQRTEAEKTKLAIEILSQQWTEFPVPHVLRMDNGTPFRGNGNTVRFLGSFVVFLLNLGIVPLFGSPSRPWTNGAVEGHNRVFTEKVWLRNRFSSLEKSTERPSASTTKP